MRTNLQTPLSRRLAQSSTDDMPATMAALAAELRTIPILVGSLLVIVSNRLWEIDRLSDEDVFFPGLWPWWTILAALLCFLYAWKPTNRWFLALSGALAVTAMASRAFAVMFRLTEGTTGLADASLHLAGAIYTLVALLLAYVWVKILRPASTLLRRARDAN